MDTETSSPTKMLSWVGLGCGVFGLVCLCISFASPFWMQTYPNSFNTFQNIGLWEVCFQNYMHHKDDKQVIYNGCWWVFNEEEKYRKLREWLLQPWFICCQVLVTTSLLANIGAVIIVGMVFLHFCPISNHEYHQTYSVFGASALMFLAVLFTLITAAVFGDLCQDWQWMPRPDMNFLSWGYGFLIISGLFSLVSGVCLYLEARRAYNDLLRQEDEWTKQMQLDQSQGSLVHSAAPSDIYPPSYADVAPYTQDQYSGYSNAGYPPGSGYNQPMYGSGYADTSGTVAKQGYSDYSHGSSGALPVKS